MNFYEAVFITRQDLAAENVDSLCEKLCNIIEKSDGKIVKKEYWGIRKLAYTINKNNKGHYFLINLESGNDGIEELRRVVSITEDIIRSNIFKVESHPKENSRLFASKDAKSFNPATIIKKGDKESKGKDKKSSMKDSRSNERKAADEIINKIVINY